MMRVVAAAVLYFLIVYCAGFLFGTVRVFVLEPRLGDFLAVLCEAPLMLAVIVLAACFVPARLQLGRDVGPLLAMGIGALVLQQGADLGLGALRGIMPAQQLAHFATPAGFVYAALLVVFVATPVVVNRRR
jgi:hypothetical protein